MNSAQMNRKAIEIRVTGRVQGVWFRDYTRTRARELGLAGFVRNEPDGSVFAVAEGEEAALDQLVAAVREGSPLSRVRDVQVTEVPATGAWKEFTIQY